MYPRTSGLKVAFFLIVAYANGHSALLHLTNQIEVMISVPRTPNYGILYSPRLLYYQLLADGVADAHRHSFMDVHACQYQKIFSKLCNKLRLYCWLVNGSLNLHVMGSILPFASFISIEFLSFFFFPQCCFQCQHLIFWTSLEHPSNFFSVQVLSIHNFFSVQVLNTHLENPAYCLMEMVSLLIARP